MKAVVFLLGWSVSVAHAAVTMDGSALRNNPEYAKARVVDARGAADSSQFPVPGALAFDRGLRLSDKRVVVIADEDNDALAAAQLLEQQNPGLAAAALLGGYDSLRIARPEVKLWARASNNGKDFVIPSDTCQTGEPLHTYEGGR